MSAKEFQSGPEPELDMGPSPSHETLILTPVELLKGPNRRGVEDFHRFERVRWPIEPVTTLAAGGWTGLVGRLTIGPNICLPDWFAAPSAPGKLAWEMWGSGKAAIVAQ